MILLSLLLLVCFNAYSNDIITPHNIAAQSSEMPPKLKEMVDEFLTSHPKILQTIVATTDSIAMTEEEVVQELEQSMQALKEEGIIVPLRGQITVHGKKLDIPRNSYVIGLPYEVDGKFYVLVAAGPINKLHTLKSYNRTAYNKHLNPEKDKKSPTYQTVTQAFHANKVNKIITNEHITTFEDSEIYLVQIPGRSDINKEACDENSIIVRRFYEEPWVSLQYNLECIQHLSRKHLEELFAVTKGAGIHFLGDDGNLMVNTCNYRLAIRDFQGPNDQNPDHPFNGQEPYKENFWQKDGDIKEYAQYKKEHTLACAVCGFAKILNEAEEEGFDVQDQWKTWRDSVINDPEFSRYDEGLRNQMRECVRG